MRLAGLIASGLLIFISGGSVAAKPVPPATMEGLATAWVGGTAWSDYVRLDLTPDGTG